MPPKTPSSARKEPILWFVCETCNVNITSKDRDQHDRHCPITAFNGRPPQPFSTSFVHNRALYSSAVVGRSPPAESLVNDLPESQLNGMIFISEAAMQLCGFVLGDWVACSSPQFPNRAAIIRTAWPMPNTHLTTVFITPDGKHFGGKM